MNIAQIEKNLSELLENISQEDFIYNLLLAYGIAKSTVTRIKKENADLFTENKTIEIKGKLFFQDARNQDLYNLIDIIKDNKNTYTKKPRFIVVTDYKTILAIDTKIGDTLDIEIADLNKSPFFFAPWAGIEKTNYINENPADVKAAEKMARIYDGILENEDNKFKTQQDLHELNIFLSRLLFCFFAEDTGIFEINTFTNAVESHTQPDGSDLDTYLNKLFTVLNQKENDRKACPNYLNIFPYVNGELFDGKYSIPKFSRKSRRMIIECGRLDWSAINPDIFGSMIQAVVHPNQRSGWGMHYTSVPNIMKVIEPLFLNELREKFDTYFDNKKKLQELLNRLKKLCLFDPACGSGNFLIIAYKEIRELEIQIFQRLQTLADNKNLPLSNISLSQFYGIELDDFAHEIAILALWLAEHQMNLKFKEIFGKSQSILPLKKAGKIKSGNAALINWEQVCPRNKNSEIYILGNPPYAGARKQNANQKDDMRHVFKNSLSKYNNLDYISCWFFKAANYTRKTNCKYAFVSTSSICQGNQVAVLWPHILKNNLEIFFAYKPFKWSNNAKSNAAVTCVIIGIRNISNAEKKFIIQDSVQHEVDNISNYLSNGKNISVKERLKPLSALPEMAFGSMLNDGGHLIFSQEEVYNILHKNPNAAKYFKKFLGAKEFTTATTRFCIWVTASEAKEKEFIEIFSDRIKKVRSYRRASKRSVTQRLAQYPYQFGEDRHQAENSIIIPRVSTERRQYILCDFIDDKTIIADSALAIYNPPEWVFGVIQSTMHMAWVRLVAGRLGVGIRYSIGFCYNNFPFPNISEKQKQIIVSHVRNIIGERERHSERTIMKLYDPDKMPDGLKEAHKNLDIVIERCYRSRPFTSDEERLDHLVKLHEHMASKESIV